MASQLFHTDKFEAVTKSDTVDLTSGKCNALYVGGAGDVIVLAADGTTSVTFKAVPVGTVLPIGTKRVMNGTTATLLVALY